MAVQHVELETTFESLVERAHRLEHDAIELRAELDEMAVLLAWRLEHSISSRALQKIAVADWETVQYRAMLTEKYPAAALRLVIQAQKVASQIKRSLAPAERRAAIAALRAAFSAAAIEQHLEIPDELVAVVGD
ncbi:MAG: hypothetical protein HY327_01455 [Chloroflexi bacterium]|nr:hypothetical protein [Chloroflexota bacterium]